jgi:hypothetical protein
LFHCNLEINVDEWAIRFWDVNTLNQPNRAQDTEQLTVNVWELSCTQIWFEFSCILTSYNCIANKDNKQTTTKL